NLLAIEPAGVVELHAIDHDHVRQRLGMTADHQRGGKRPWLRGEIAHAAADDAGLFAGFPPHGVLDRLTRFHEARQARPHARLKAVRTAEHATLARNRKHDRDWIGAGKMLDMAGRAIAPPTGFDDVGGGATIRTEVMTTVPVEERLAFGERRQV